MDGNKQQRLDDASSLHGVLAALKSVDKDQRYKIIDDRICLIIDNCCQKKEGETKAAFSPQQIDRLKYLCFNLAYLNFHEPEKKPSIIRGLWLDYAAQSPLKRVGYFVAVLTFISPQVGLVVSSIRYYGGLVIERIMEPAVKDAAKQTPPPAPTNPIPGQLPRLTGEPPPRP